MDGGRSCGEETVPEATLWASPDGQAQVSLWIDQVTKDLEELEVPKWTEMAQKRDEWHVLFSRPSPTAGP